MNGLPPSLALDANLAGFLGSHLSIHVAASDDNGDATLVRGLGCRVSPDRRRVTVLVSRSQGERVLRCIEANGRIAVAFTEPETHRTVQLKGQDAAVEPALAEDLASLEPYTAALARRLAVFEVPEPYVRALFACSPGDLVAVGFHPDQAYGQTPGPQAGSRLDGLALR